jgi:transposase
MKQIREILRLKCVQQLSHREAAKSTGLSAGSVASVLARAKDAGLDWEGAERLDDVELETLLYGERRRAGADRPLPDPVWMHRELRRKGVTLELLHIEYLERHPDGYRYTAFCDHYRRWLKKRSLSMRQNHKAGEKMFVDYSGDRGEVVDPNTGEVHAVELFVAVLGASNLTFVDATLTQSVKDWIESHSRAVEYFGGVSRLVVPDQLKSGVTAACCYEPVAQRTYAEWATHVGTALLPARVRKPKDKAKAEQGVLGVQRWILARVRNETHFSLASFRQRVGELLAEYNARPMGTYGGMSRRQLFNAIERDALKTPPSQRFEYAEWKAARVNIDYHVAYEKHFYSVPHSLSHEQVDVRASRAVIEVFHRGVRVASHARSSLMGRHTTVAEHMPKAHQKHLEWSPSRLIHWGGSIGPRCQELVQAILESRPHPEQGYRSCLGLLRLGKAWGDDRLEKACARALRGGARSYRHVESILKHGLDKLPLADAAHDGDDVPLPAHNNVRGADYYQ